MPTLVLSFSVTYCTYHCYHIANNAHCQKGYDIHHKKLVVLSSIVRDPLGGLAGRVHNSRLNALKYQGSSRNLQNCVLKMLKNNLTNLKHLRMSTFKKLTSYPKCL